MHIGAWHLNRCSAEAPEIEVMRAEDKPTCSDYQLINFFGYDHVLLRGMANDHCSVDTPLLATYVQGATARRRRPRFVPLFFESNSTFLGFVLQVPLVPKEVARWAADERSGFLGAAIKHDSSYGYLQ